MDRLYKELHCKINTILPVNHVRDRRIMYSLFLPSDLYIKEIRSFCSADVNVKYLIIDLILLFFALLFLLSDE